MLSVKRELRWKPPADRVSDGRYSRDTTASTAEQKTRSHRHIARIIMPLNVRPISILRKQTRTAKNLDRFKLYNGLYNAAVDRNLDRVLNSGGNIIISYSLLCSQSHPSLLHASAPSGLQFLLQASPEQWMPTLRSSNALNSIRFASCLHFRLRYWVGKFTREWSSEGE